MSGRKKENWETKRENTFGAGEGEGRCEVDELKSEERGSRNMRARINQGSGERLP